MKKTISLYTLTTNNAPLSKRVDGFWVTKTTYPKSEIRAALAEANNYLFRHYNNSYHESYYDDQSTYFTDVAPETILLKDGALFGFVIDCSQRGQDTYHHLLLLTDANTDKELTTYYSATDHGDTMSGETHRIKLVTKKK